MSKQMNLPFHYIMHIIRKGFPEIFNLSQDKFLEQVEIIVSLFDQCNSNKIEDSKEEYPTDNESWDMDLAPYFDEHKYLQVKLGQNQWKQFSKEVFAVFWSLEIQDIMVPEDMYTQCIQDKQEDMDKLLKESAEESKKDALRNDIKLLRQELESQRAHQKKVKAYLKEHLSTYFSNIE